MAQENEQCCISRVRIAFRWLDPDDCADLAMPGYETEHASGMDVSAAVSESVVIQPGAIHLIPSGFAVAIPPGFEIQIRPRSGLAVKHGVTIINAPGTIDADYRGEVKIGLVNLGPAPFTVHRGDRIAQMVVGPVVRADLAVVRTLEQTVRGSGGFGSTGMQ